MLVHAYAAVDWGGEGVCLIWGSWRKAGPLTLPWLGMARLRAATLLHNRHIPFLPTTFATTLTSISNLEDGGGTFLPKRLSTHPLHSTTQLVCSLRVLSVRHVPLLLGQAVFT